MFRKNFVLRMLKYYVLLFLKISILISVNAQKSGSTNWEDLYADNFIRVQIQFYIPAQSTCLGTNGKKFRFKYRVMGSYRNYPTFLILPSRAGTFVTLPAAISALRASTKISNSAPLTLACDGVNTFRYPSPP